MKKTINSRCCPKCANIELQYKHGFNSSGTQRYKCYSCGFSYTLKPKSNEYSESIREQAIKLYYSGVSGRGVGKIMDMSKANVVRWIKKKQKI
jgi:transposase-like protein